MDISITHRWRRLVPDIGDNLKAAKPFFLEVAEGVTNDRMERLLSGDKAIVKESAAKTREELAGVMAQVVDGLVRLGTEPLTINGEKVETVEQYLLIAARSSNCYLWFELVGTLIQLNTLAGGMELFWQRQSGGTSTTPDQTVAKGESLPAPR